MEKENLYSAPIAEIIEIETEAIFAESNVAGGTGDDVFFG